MIHEDMKPALGVTEPGAIAFAVAAAKTYLGCEVGQVRLRLNSGMFKNAFTCGIPGIREVGNYHAAALGAVAADPEQGLECLEGITDELKAQEAYMVEDGRISVEMSGISSRILIEALVTAAENPAHTAQVTIRDAHTNIVKVTVDGRTVRKADEQTEQAEGEAAHHIHDYTLEQLYTYAKTVPAKELAFLREAYRLNRELMQEGLESGRTTFGPYLLAANGGKLVSDDERKTASLFCNAAIEARVIGLSRPAMSVTGSGAHGIIATMPLYAAYLVNGYSEEALLRATALSCLVCMYLKEYSGKLSAFCGCAIAAGTGSACGLVLLRNGTTAELERTICNMASSITGMICDGGNQGCTMKGIVAVDTAFASADLAMKGISVDPVHGINGRTPEETMRNMGQIASPGMTGTEKTIVDILNSKRRETEEVRQ